MDTVCQRWGQEVERDGLNEEELPLERPAPARRSRRRGRAAQPGTASVPVKEIMVTFEDPEPKVAVLEDGVLVELDLEGSFSRRLVGNIYKGRVQNVLPGMQAAFVDIGLERNAFLFVSDARPPCSDDGSAQAAQVPIQALVHPGEEILVQIGKEPSGSKGSRVTRHVSLAGRYLVLMPGAGYVGVSRRLEDETERQRLRAIAEELRAGSPMGIIVRTAAQAHIQEDLAQDAAFLAASWQEIEERARRTKAPALLHQDLDVVHRMVRDLVSGDVRRIVVDRRDAFERISELVRALAPGFASTVELALPQNGQQLFAARGIDPQIDRALARKVPLPSGGYLVIDQTEALTVVDVNTGRYVGSDSVNDTFLKTNLEATGEIARQLRLRDIGGIIVIDFIDMEIPAHRKQLVQALTEACRMDHSKPEVLGLTALGLVEMTRKKARQGLREILTKPCPTCDGRGRVHAEDLVAHRARGLIRTALRNSGAEAVLVEVHPPVAALLIGMGGAAVRQLEEETGRSIFIRGAGDCLPEEVRILAQGERRVIEEDSYPVREGQHLEVVVEKQHISSQGDGIAKLQGYVIDIDGGAAHVGERVTVEVTRAFRTFAKARIL